MTDYQFLPRSSVDLINSGHILMFIYSFVARVDSCGDRMFSILVVAAAGVDYQW